MGSHDAMKMLFSGNNKSSSAVQIWLPLGTNLGYCGGVTGSLCTFV